MMLVRLALGLLLLALILRLFFQATTVYEFQRALRYRGGRFVGVVGPGRYWQRRGGAGHLTLVDVRPRLVTVPGQEVLTEDGIGVKISLAARFEIVDVARAVHGHADFEGEAYSALQLLLRDRVAVVPLDRLVAERASIGADLLTRAAPAFTDLGLKILEVEVKDIMYAKELKRAFNQVVLARQEALAALEKARGEAASLRTLANAAALVEARPALMQLRALQAVGADGGTLVLGLGGADAAVASRAAGRKAGGTKGEGGEGSEGA